MGRRYTASFDAVAVTAVQDFFEIAAGSSVLVVVHRLELWQTTDLGDAQEEVLRLRIRSGQTTTGSGGTSPSMVPVEAGDAAATSTVKANNTTQASGGTIVVNEAFGWNIRTPLDRIWTPETRPIIRPSRRATFELLAAPADSITMSGMLTFEEIG